MATETPAEARATDSADATADEKPIHLWNTSPSFAFLPREGDFIIVCGDDRCDEEGKDNDQNPEGALNAFGVSRGDLVKKSPFFAEMLQLSHEATTGTSGGQCVVHRLQVEEAGCVVGIVLSAAMEPTRSYVEGILEWDHLNAALRLAVKWRVNDARIGIFLAMQHWLLVMEPDPQDWKTELTELLVEAARQGESAIYAIAATLRLKASQSSGAIVLTMLPLTFSEIHFLEIGAAGCSLVAQTVIKLAREGRINL